MRNVGGYIRYFKDNLEDLKGDYSNTFTTKKLIVTDSIDIANIDKVDISGLNKWKEGNNYEITYTKGLVGIHTETPEHTLDVSGNTAIRGTLYVRDISGVDVYSWTRKNGHLYTTSALNNVGIGTESPSMKLDVSGDAIVRGTLTVSDLSGVDIKQWTRNNGALYNTNLNSFVGIGTSSPAFNLDVSGEARIYTNRVKLGNFSGNVSQGSNAVAVGVNTGRNNQGNNTVAVGMNSGMNNQAGNSVAVGFGAGNNLQGVSSIAIGTNAGQNRQSDNVIAIGTNSGQNKQGENTIAIGTNAGLSGEQTGAVSIGYQAGMSNQGRNSVALGVNAGATNQGVSSVAIGENSGKMNLGDFSVAIGANANSVNKNNIVINATGTDLNATDSSGLYIAPIKYTDDKGNMDVLVYDRNTKEIKCTTSGSFSGGAGGSSAWTDNAINMLTNTNYKVGIGMNNPIESLDVCGNIRVRGNIQLNDYNINNVSNINLDSGSYIRKTDMTLDINSDKNINIADNKIFVTKNGRVGINTNNPTSKLDIDGDILIRGNAYLGADVYINNDYEIQGDVNVVKYNKNDNSVYVGGRFNTILVNKKDTIIANNICKLDLNNGIVVALFGGLTDSTDSGDNAYCYAIEFDNNNNIYVGGTFTKAGGILCNNIARFYNNSWYSIFKGVSSTSGTVSCKTIAILYYDQDNHVIYFGGNFSQVQLTTETISSDHNNIFCYAPINTPDFTTNTTDYRLIRIGTLGNSGLNNTCNVIYPVDNRIYVGGKFTSAGGNSNIRYLGYFTHSGNNITWYQLISNGFFINNINTEINSIIFNSNKTRLFVAGFFSSAIFSGLSNFGFLDFTSNNTTLRPINSFLYQGFNGKCNYLGMDTSDNIYIGGEFTGFVTNFTSGIGSLIKITSTGQFDYNNNYNLEHNVNSFTLLPNRDIFTGSKYLTGNNSLYKWNNRYNKFEDYLVYKNSSIYFDPNNYISNNGEKLNVILTKPLNINNQIDVSSQIAINSRTTFNNGINLNNKSIENIASIGLLNSRIDVSSSKLNISSTHPVSINNTMSVLGDGSVSISGDLYISKVLYVKDISGITINTQTSGDGIWDICNNKVYTNSSSSTVSIGTNNPDTSYKLYVIGDAYLNNDLRVNKIKGVGTQLSIGENAGGFGNNSIAIGNNAASNNQGDYSIAIGNSAGESKINQNSIILNATESDISSNTTGFFVAPIRETDTGKYTLKYDTSKNEVVYEKNTWELVNDDVVYNNGNVGIGKTNPSVRLDVSGRTIMTDVSATNLDISGNLRVKGVNVVSSQWTTSDSNISYTAGRTLMTDVSATNLDLSGYIKASQLVDSTNSSGSAGQVLTKSGNNLSWSNPAMSTQWTTSGSNISYTAGRTLMTDVSATNLDISGNLRVKGVNVVSSQWITSGSNISYTAGRTLMTDVSATNLDLSGYIKASQLVDSTNSSGSSGQILTKSGNNLSWSTPAMSTQWTTTGSKISYMGGYVGINTNNPLYNLEVNGTLKAQLIADRYGNVGGPGSVLTSTGIDGEYEWKQSPWFESFGVLYTYSNIGINSDSPSYNLDVNGDFRATQIIDNIGSSGSSGQVLTKSGNNLSWTTPSGTTQWTTSGSNISYTAGRTLMTDVSATNLDLSGYIKASQLVDSTNSSGSAGQVLTKSGNNLSWTTPSGTTQWTTNGSNISYTAGRTLMTDVSATNLDLSNSLNVRGRTLMTDVSATNLDLSGNLRVKGVSVVSSQWTTTGSNISYTAGRTLMTDVSATNIDLSGYIKASQLVDSTNSSGSSGQVLTKSGNNLSWTTPSGTTQWTTTGSNISYTAGRTLMTDVSATNLDISGSLNYYTNNVYGIPFTISGDVTASIWYPVVFTVPNDTAWQTGQPFKLCVKIGEGNHLGGCQIIIEGKNSYWGKGSEFRKYYFVNHNDSHTVNFNSRRFFGRLTQEGTSNRIILYLLGGATYHWSATGMIPENLNPNATSITVDGIPYNSINTIDADFNGVTGSFDSIKREKTLSTGTINDNNSNADFYLGTSGGETTLYLGGGNSSDSESNNNTVIQSRTYQSGTEKTELLLFKGNDSATNFGPDRIRLRAGAIAFDTYASSTNDRTTENIRMYIDANGNVGIGKTNPSVRLDVNGRTLMTDVSATNMNLSGTLGVAGRTIINDISGTNITISNNAQFKNILDSNGNAGSSNNILISTSNGCAWTNPSSIRVGDADIADYATNADFANNSFDNRWNLTGDGGIINNNFGNVSIMNGNFGINTLNPQTRLEVIGDAYFDNIVDSTGITGSNNFILTSNGGGNGYTWTDPQNSSVGTSTKTTQIMTNAIVSPSSSDMYFGLFDSSLNNYQNIRLHDKIRYNPSTLNLTIDGSLKASQLLINKSSSQYPLDVSGIINASELYLNNQKVEFASITNTNIINQETFGKTLKKNSIIYQKPVTIKKSDIVLKLDNVIDKDQIYTFGPSQQNMYIMGLGNDSSNSMLYSFNGFDWLPINNSKQILEECNSIKYNGSIWIGVGSGSNNSIVYSYNGLDWSGVPNNKTSIFTVSASCVEWSVNMWVAGGNGTSNSIAYSYNGIDWSGINNSKVIFSTSCNDIICNGRMWVAGGSGTNTLGYSYNGIDWSGIGLGIFSNNCNSIAWNGHMWVAVGNGTSNNIAYSYNGIDWSGIGLSIFSTIGNNVLWNGNIWVAVGSGTNSIAYSYNGTDWNGVVNSTTIFSSGRTLSWDGNMIFALGNNNKIAYSYNGINWNIYTNSTAKTTSRGECIAFNNRRKYTITVPRNMWVACGLGDNHTIAYSYNGLDWSGAGRTVFNQYARGVAWNGNMWVGVGSGINPNKNSIAYSYNGIDWYGLGSNIFSSSGIGVLWNGNMWVAVGDGTNNSIAYSYNGLDWSGAGRTVFNQYASGVAWNGNMWVVVGSGTNHSIAYSYDGIDWSGANNSKTIFDSDGNGIAWNGNIWVAVGRTNHSIAYSYNGIDWVGAGTSVFNFGGKGVSWNGNMWVAVGNGTNNSIAYSYNGINWVGAGTSVFNFGGDGIATNNNYAKINCPDTITLNNYPNNQLDIVSEGYYNRGFTNMSMSIKSTNI